MNHRVKHTFADADIQHGRLERVQQQQQQQHQPSKNTSYVNHCSLTSGRNSDSGGDYDVAYNNISSRDRDVAVTSSSSSSSLSSSSSSTILHRYRDHHHHHVVESSPYRYHHNVIDSPHRNHSHHIIESSHHHNRNNKHHHQQQRHRSSHRDKDHHRNDHRIQCEVCSIKTVFKCRGCSIAYYCSRLHQKQDWNKHKRFCKVITRSRFRGLVSSKRTLQTAHQQSLLSRHQHAVISHGPDDCFIDAKSLECYEQLVSFVFKALMTIGLCVIDNFVHDNIANGVLYETKAVNISADIKEHDTNVDRERGLGLSDNVTRDGSRENTWITGKEKLSTNIKFLIQTFQNLIDALRLGEYGHGRLTHRSHVQVSCHRENSKGFPPRVDNPSGVASGGCLLTAAYHCNREYEREACGGVSRYYLLRTKYVDIEPKFNRAVIRWSDKRILHEVLPCRQHKLFSLTTWYFDYSKSLREKLKNKTVIRRTDSGTSNASSSTDSSIHKQQQQHREQRVIFYND